jgi:hypothetical protein
MKTSLLVAGALAFALFFASPVAAQQCDKFDVVAAQMEGVDGLTIEILEPDAVKALVEKIDPALVGLVTRAFVLDGSARVIAGLEIDGCLLPPIVLFEKSQAVQS